MVAIIAVLVAISIPIFASQRRKARLAVNQANARAAKEVAAAAYLTDGKDSTVCFAESGTGQQETDTPSAGTADSFPHGKNFYVAWNQKIFDPISSWTVDTQLRPSNRGNAFCAGDKVAKAWLVTVEYNISKGNFNNGDAEKNADTTGEFDFAIVALYDGERIGTTNLYAGNK